MPFSFKTMRWGCATQASTAISTTTTTTSAVRNSFSFTFKKHRPSLDSATTHDSTRRHSSAEVTDYLRRRRKSSADISDTAGSSSHSRRYLLSDTSSFREEGSHLLERKDTELLALEMASSTVTEVVKPGRDHRSMLLSGDRRSGFSQLSVVKSSTPSRPQVVVLRVSLHCRGCESKLRKHLSKMEGVTSFDIDFEMKKVSVTGNVTPLYVLNSITRVKNAQFWPSPTTSTTSTSSSSSGSATSEFSY